MNEIMMVASQSDGGSSSGKPRPIQRTPGNQIEEIPTSDGLPGGTDNNAPLTVPHPFPNTSLSSITTGAQGQQSGITADTLVNINNYSGINLSLISENPSNSSMSESREEPQSSQPQSQINMKPYTVETERVIN